MRRNPHKIVPPPPPPTTVKKGGDMAPVLFWFLIACGLALAAWQYSQMFFDAVRP
ncbi:hypothetical protein ABIB89_003259 [Bradyrhizobium sp. JR3.12]